MTPRTGKTWLRLVFISMIFFLLCSPAQAGDGATPSNSGFRVLDIGERTYEGGPALAVVFSQPLDPKERHDRHLRLSDSEQLIQSAWILSEDHRVLYCPQVEPNTQYSLVVLETLKSASGQSLAERAIKSVTTRQITPGVNFASNGILLPGRLAQGLPVAVVNVKIVEIEFFRLNDLGLRDFVRWQHSTGRDEVYQLENLSQFGQFVYSGRFDLDPPKNKRIISHIPLQGIEALQKPGLYFAVMRRPGEYGYDYQSTHFLVTDIGLHVHVFANQALVMASSLTNGQPLSEVKITLYNDKLNPVGYGATDEKGRYVFPNSISGKKVAFLKAEQGDHLSILPFDIPALDLSGFTLEGRTQQAREALVYSPRDLYRPGETVFVSALLRDYDGRPTKNLPLAAVLLRPDGKKVRTFTWYAEDIKDAGYYHTQLEVSSEAQTGRYTLELRDNPGASLPVGVFKFQVEDFMPERLKLELTSKSETIALDQDWPIDVAGAYLYGAPAAGNKIETMIRMAPKRDILENLKGYQFGDVDDRQNREEWEFAGDLNKDGLATLKVDNRWAEARVPLSVRATVSLYETGGRPVNRSISRVVWPARTLVGVRPLFDDQNYLEEGLAEFEIVKAAPDGRLLPAQGLMVNLIKEERDYYWEYSAARGWEHKYSEKHYEIQSDLVNIEENRFAPYKLDLRSGVYLLKINDPETGLITSLRFRVGYWWSGGTQEAASRPDQVEIKLDKPSYLPGDTVKMTILPPHDGEAAIAVEGSRLLWFSRASVSAKGTELEIPVLAHWDSHDLYISVVVFRPGDSKEKITPNRALGLVHLNLDRSRRRIEVDIEAPERLSPQGPTGLPVKLKLKEASDKETYVTLAAVDVGILNITAFKTPDPFAWFFAPRSYPVDYFDLYGRVVELMDGSVARLQCGGDADSAPGGKRPETKVKLLTLFQGPVAFDQNGEANLDLIMPGDFNGRVRLMALVFNADSFGSAEKEVTVAAPVVTQLATPRFMAPGDKVQFTLDVHNLSGQAQELNLTLTATEPLQLEDGQRVLALADQEKVSLTFPVIALDSFGPSQIRLQVEGQGLSLSSDWQLGVRPAYPGVSRKVRHILKAGDVFTLDQNLAADLMPASYSADVKISSVIPINYRQALRDLLQYPYGCLEQTTSRAYPLLFATGEKIEKYHLPFINQKERIKQLDYAIEKIALMQTPNGGFGLWDQQSPEEPWLTAYAAEFLLLARDQGLEVSPGVLEKAMKRLDYYLQRQFPKTEEQMSRIGLDFAIRSYAAYVLSGVGRAPLGTMRILFDDYHKKARSGLPLAHLGLALKAMGDQKRGDQALALAAESIWQENDAWGDYGSSIRDLALTLALFLENDAQSQVLEKVMLRLEDAVRHRRYFSTQEKYAIFKVGLALEKINGRPWQGKLRQGDQETALDQKGYFLFAPTLEQINSGVSFRSTSQGLVFISAIVNGYTKTPPEMENSSVEISRQIYFLDGKPASGQDLKVGDLLLVHLNIDSEVWMPDGLVVDLLPAAFEIENPNFTNSVKIDETDLEDLKIGKNSLNRLKRNNQILHQEFRDDRYVAVMNVSRYKEQNLFYLVRVVSPGTYFVPPPFIESMYQPDIRGIGLTPPPIRILNR